uniref:VWFA domain-containing protein n=1 Tax=Plectus sambesii TaxID=2011161 RepID=A0A914XB40_9BILA
MFNSNSVNSTIWLNTFNNQALLASAIGALQYVPSSVNTTDVPGVINYLMNTILNPVNGYRQKLTFVTFINVAASSTTSIDLAQSQINQLKALSAQLFAFQYTATSGNLMPFIPVTNRADVSRTGFAWSSAGVQNYLSFVQDKWAAYQQNIPTGPPLPIPLTNVYADIVFVIDGTSALTQDAFNTVISYIITLSDSFYIDPKSTQFSVMFFASGPTPLSGTILLNSARTNAELQNRIRQIPYPNSQVSNWNLISALNYTTGLLLTPAQGWRNQGGIITIVVFIGIADSETTNSCDILNNQGQVPLSQKAQGIFAIALNSKQSTSNYLHCVIPQTHNFARADPPTSLVQYSDADNSLRTYMSNAYQNFVNSGTGGLPPIDPKLIATDIVFVVDQTFYVSASSFGFLQDFMVNFLSQFTIDPSRVLASVVTFDSAAKDSFPLWRANTTLGLQNAIYGLKSAGSTAYEFNVQSAINYLLQYILTPAQGHAPGKSATVIFLAASPAASMTTYDQIEQLNSIASVYGIDFIDNGAANNYLLRLVNFNPYSVFRTQFPSYLVSTESEGSKRVTLFTSNAYNYYLNNPPVPIASVHSDIAIIIDNTQSLTPTIFAYIKTWLMSYVQKYSVTPTLTQFAVVFYDNGVKNTVIYLNSVENSYQLNNTLSNLQFTASTQTAFDLAGALSYVATNIFQSSAGYRGRATSLIIVGIAP